MQHRPPAIFIADSLGLDFLNSIATPVDTPVDWLDSGDGLLKWLAQAKLVPTDVLDELRARAMPAELDKVADQTRALREWFRIASIWVGRSRTRHSTNWVLSIASWSVTKCSARYHGIVIAMGMAWNFR